MRTLQLQECFIHLSNYVIIILNAVGKQQSDTQSQAAVYDDESITLQLPGS